MIAPNAASCSAPTCGIRASTHYDDGRLSVRTGRWQLVTGIYERSTSTLSLYVDGAPQDVEHIHAVPASSGPLPLGTGLGVYAPQDFFRGAISGLRVYARALSPDEVWQLPGGGG